MTATISLVPRLLVFTGLALTAASALADVRLPAIFSDHMVLEKTSKVPVWGWANSGEEVKVSLDTQTATVTASPDGHWKAELNLAETGPGPFEMTVTGQNTIRIRDVVVGEVWIASGQSNMEWSLADSIGGPEEIAQSANPMLRQFRVERLASAEPVADAKGSWIVAEPGTAPQFTAVGYYFGKSLQKALNRPVGLINASWGGMAVEPFISPSSLSSNAELAAGARQIFDRWSSSTEARAHFASHFEAWLQAAGRLDRSRGDAAALASPSASPEGWQKVTLPGPVLFPGFDGQGAAWLRRDVVLSAQDIKEPLLLDIRTLDGFETIYWNGKKIGGTTPQDHPGEGFARRLYVQPTDLREGKNTLAIRVFAPTAPAAFTANAAEFRAGSHALQGDWLARAEFTLPTLGAAELAAAPRLPAEPPAPYLVGSFLYNAMIYPLVPYAISGVIWYQGESNAFRAAQYETSFPMLIKDWRQRWDNENLPFYFCQLANFQPKSSQPQESAWAELREAQSKTLALPKTGQAVLIDLGEAGDIHPRNKKDVGERLARIALANDYGQAQPFQGPTFQSQKVEGDKIRLTFSHTDGGLEAKSLPESYPIVSLTNQTALLIRNSPQSQVEGFAICGKDQKWFWASATIEGDSVVVSSPSVPEPVAVRYGWDNNPTCNLYNGAGLPASPFRTDDFPRVTEGARFGF